MTAEDLTPPVWADNEWSPLQSVIVGRAENSAFPSEPPHMIRATMPSKHMEKFQPLTPFPADILAKAGEELDHFAKLLEEHGVRVYRPTMCNWLKVGGYTGAMPRDGLMTVGSTIIEAPFAWRCRQHEVNLAYSGILSELANRGSVRICRAPLITGHDTLYHSVGKDRVSIDDTVGQRWAINNTRPAFDAADFMRFGKTIVGQLSHVTNLRGVEYLQVMVPEGYTVEILDTTDEHAMHIDATLLPLRDGFLVYHPERVSEYELRRHAVFRDWELHPYPFNPQPRGPQCPPLFMCSPWLVMNSLSLDGQRIMVEASEIQFASWLTEQGFKPIMCPFRHVNSIGGSFHCATVDLVRLPSEKAGMPFTNA
jgi:glycine amidinotransferase